MKKNKNQQNFGEKKAEISKKNREISEKNHKIPKKIAKIQKIFQKIGRFAADCVTNFYVTQAAGPPPLGKVCDI